jgi:hypothetical protein
MKKVMKKIPETPPHLVEKRKKEARELKYALENCHYHKIPIYYLDEASFSSRSFNKQCWSNIGKNVQVHFQYAPKAVSCVALINEKGIDWMNVKTGAFKKEDHWELLRGWRKKLGHERQVALFSDGLSFHHSKVTHSLMKELNILPIKNIAYQPHLCVVEFLWNVQKKEFKKKLTQFLSLFPAKDLNLEQLVQRIMYRDSGFEFEKRTKEKHAELVQKVGARLESS